MNPIQMLFSRGVVALVAALTMSPSLNARECTPEEQTKFNSLYQVVHKKLMAVGQACARNEFAQQDHPHMPVQIDQQYKGKIADAQYELDSLMKDFKSLVQELKSSGVVEGKCQMHSQTLEQKDYPLEQTSSEWALSCGDGV